MTTPTWTIVAPTYINAAVTATLHGLRLTDWTWEQDTTLTEPTLKNYERKDNA